MSAVEPDTLGSHWRRRLYDVREQKADPLPRHRFGSFNFQREIFERITCATAVLDDPVIAFRQIDQALAAARRHCKPVYLEFPRDRVMSRGHARRLPGRSTHRLGLRLGSHDLSSTRHDPIHLQEFKP